MDSRSFSEVLSVTDLYSQMQSRGSYICDALITLMRLTRRCVRSPAFVPVYRRPAHRRRAHGAHREARLGAARPGEER